MGALRPDQKFIEIDGVKLKVHIDYDPIKRQECNGCGSGWNEPLVPDRIYLLPILNACCPHDYRYSLGGTEEDKAVADEEFLYNMNAIIQAYGAKHWYYPTYLAMHRATTYYYFVVESDEAMEKFMANNKKGDSDGSDTAQTDTLGSADDQRCDHGTGEQWRCDRKHRVFRSKSKRGV